LGYFPGEGAFPSARTEEQDIHSPKIVFNAEMCECAYGQIYTTQLSPLGQ
jgi:hypothetical protein